MINQLDENDKLEGHIYLSSIFREQGKYEKANEIIDQVILLASEDYLLKLLFKAFAEKIYIVYRQDNFSEALLLAYEAKELEISLDESFDLNNEKFIIATVLGNIHYRKSQNEKAEKYYKYALELAELSNYYNLLSQAYNSIAIVSTKKGEWKNAINYHEKCFKFATECGNLKYQIYSNSNIGEIYRQFGLFNKALKYYKKALHLNRDNTIASATPILNLNVGLALFKIKDINNSKHHIELAYNEFKKQNSQINITEALLYLILINLELGNSQIAENYLTEFSNLEYDADNKTIQIRLEISKAIILKYQNTYESIRESTSILEDIVARDFVYVEYNVMAILHLCDNYLDEYQKSNDLLYLNQAEQLLDKTENLSIELNSHVLKIESKVLRAKLYIIKSELERVDRLLLEAKELSNRIDLGMITSNLKINHVNIINNIAKKNKINFYEKFEIQRKELIKLTNIISNFVKNNLDEDIQDMYDYPLKFSIYHRTGKLWYTYDFPNNTEFSEYLEVESILVPYIYNSHQIVNDVLCGDFNIKYLINGENVLVCIFKGNTQIVYTKLVSILFQIQNITPNGLLENIFRDLTMEDKSLIDGIAREIFMKLIPISIIGKSHDDIRSTVLSDENIEELLKFKNSLPDKALQIIRLINGNTSFEKIGKQLNLDDKLLKKYIDEMIDKNLLTIDGVSIEISNTASDILNQYKNILNKIFDN